MSANSNTHSGNGSWPAPGNYTINKADKPREGNGEWHSRTGGKHEGIDIVGKEGDRIESFGAGRVIFSGVMKGYGNTVVVQQYDGLQTVYAHLKTRSVQEKDDVGPDTQIGTMGRTGNTPKLGDTHLHFEIRENANGVVLGGHTVNPRKYLQFPGQEHAPRQPASSGPSQSGERPRSNDAPMADGVLKIGERGAEVRAMQETLNRLGYTGKDGKPLETRSGMFGPHTEHALKQFQAAHDLEADGKAGRKETLPALAQAVQRPLVSEKIHPAHSLYAAIQERLPPGTAPGTVANVTLQAMENGIITPEKLSDMKMVGRDVWVVGTIPGERVRVDLDAPTAGLQQSSDHMARQSREAALTGPQQTPNRDM